MSNNLAAITRYSYCMSGNNALRAYESYRPRKKIIFNITGLLPRAHFFVHEIIFILVHANFICYPKKFRAIFDKNLISVHDTNLV